MYKTCKMRVISMLLALIMIVSCFPVNALAAYTEVTPGYQDLGTDDDGVPCGKVSLHNDKTTVTKDDLKGWFNLDSFCIKLDEEIVCSTLKPLQDGFTVKDGKTYTVEKINLSGTLWKPQITYELKATFTVKIYDTLTIETIKDGQTTEETKNIYRGDSYEFALGDTTGYEVTVSELAKKNADGSYTVGELEKDAKVTIQYVADTQSVIEIGSNEGKAEVVYPSTVDAGAEATVKITPQANQYISQVQAVDLEENVVTWTKESYLSDQKGTYEGSFTAADTKTVYKLHIISAPVLDWDTEKISINYNEKSSPESAVNAILQFVSAADGIDRSKLKVEYKAREKGFLRDEVWQEIGMEAPTLGHAFGQEEEAIRITYVYDESMPQYPEAMITATINTEDTRVEPTIQIKTDVEIGYTGTAITREQVLNAVFDSVVYEGKTIVDTVTEDIEISSNLIGSWADKIKEDGTTGSVLGDIGGTFDYNDVEGNYKVTITYAGNEDYKATTKEATFSVYDNRLETTIEVQDVKVDAKDLGAISYEKEEVKEKMLLAIKDQTGKDLDKDDVEIESVWSTTGVIPLLTSFPLKEVGEYKVNFKYADTATHKSSTASATFTICDARPTAEITLKENAEISYTANDPVTEEKVKALIESVTPESATYTISVKDGSDNPIDVSQITEAGTYTVVVEIKDSNTYKGCTKSVSFTVTDGRHVTVVHIDENSSVNYNYTNDGLSEKEILEALHVSVLDTKEESQINDYKVTFYDSKDKKVTPEDMKVGKTYKISVIFEGNQVQAPASKTAEFTVVDGRKEAELTLKQDVSLVYKGEKYTEEEILEAVFESLTNDEGENISSANLTVSAKDVLNVGTYDVTVKFEGDAQYKPVSATTVLTVNKADAKVNVTSKTAKYKDMKKDGVNVSELITTTPEKASCIEFAVGVSLGEEAKEDTAAVAYVNLPALIDTDALPASIKKVVEGILSQIENGTSMSITGLKDTLEGILKALEGIEGILDYAGIKIDTEAIETLVKTLETIENLNGINELQIKLTMGKDIIVKDAGLYIIGGVVSDSNYNTAANVGYLLITPQATKVKLAFNVEDENGIITRKAILNGDYDLGSHVEEEGLTKEELADANAHLKNLYLGVDMKGNTIVSEEPSAEIGAYTQIAFIADLGNEMYYAVPIIRSYMVVCDTAIVKFVDETGAVNHDRLFTYDGNAHEMKAVATDRYGNLLPEENLSYKYIGVEGDGEGYNSSEAPVHAGAYTVIATYLDPDYTYAGAAVGAMVICPAEAAIKVNDKTYTYDGKVVDVLSMIEKTPDDAKMAVMMAGIDVNGDFSENSWRAVDGVVNIDFPTRVDEVLKKVVPKAYEDGIKITDFLDRLNDVKDNLTEKKINTESLDTIVDVLKEMSEKVTLTFKEQSEVNPTNIGAYLVSAMILDPDYKKAADTGVLLIVPEVTKADLKWNQVDENGVITSPILHTFDFTASAYVKGELNQDITGKIQYIFKGVDAQGNEVNTADVSKLTNGVYTQIAYVAAEDVSASMTIAAPLVRTIIIAPQMATVEFVDETGAVNYDRQFVYDGTPKAMDVRVTLLDGTVVKEDRLNENLTVRYIGIDAAAGSYDSTTPPSNAGAYEVTATYVEKDADGKILYAGTSLGAMVIKPQEGRFDVLDTTVTHDGTEKFADIDNEAGMSYIAVVADEQYNVNILFPESWNIDEFSFEVDDNINQLISVIEKLPMGIQNKDLIKNLKAILEKIEIHTLTVNGKKPVEVGTYKITALAYAANTTPVIDSGVLTITHDWSDEYKHDETNHWKECNYCGMKTEEGTHTGGKATCKEQATCEICGELYGKLADHVYGDPEIKNFVDSTCDMEGSYDLVFTCTVCGDEKTEHYSIEPSDEKHILSDPVKENIVEATCTEVGSYDWVVNCTVCGKEMSRTPMTIPAKGHTDGDEVRENVIEATCTEDGSYDLVVYCSVCGEKVRHSTVTVKAHGHHFGEWKVVKEATVTETGLKERVCSECSAKEEEIIPMTENTDSGNTPGKDDTDKKDPMDKEDKNPETGDNTVDTTDKKTGDNSQMILWMALCTVSFMAISIFLLERFRRKRS